MENNYFGDDDLVYNTASRIPICLCIDTSGSMGKKDDTSTSRIKRVKDGIKKLYKELEDNEMTKYSAEIAIVGFSTLPYVVQDFKTVLDIDKKEPELTTHAKGDLGKGVLKSLELLNKRKMLYKENGIDYYQPWLIIMTDGRPTGDENVMSDLKKAKDEVRKLEEENKLTVITVFIGKMEDNASLKDIDSVADAYLKDFSKRTELPLILTSGKNFGKFFEFIGKSVSGINENNTISLDFADLTDWNEL